jgi:hypothetical protein
MCDEKVVGSLEKGRKNYQLPLRSEQNQEGCLGPEQLSSTGQNNHHAK